MIDEKEKRVTVIMKPELHARVKALSESTGLKIQAIALHGLEKEVAELEKKGKGK